MGVNERDRLDGQSNIALLLPMASSDSLIDFNFNVLALWLLLAG